MSSWVSTGDPQPAGAGPLIAVAARRGRRGGSRWFSSGRHDNGGGRRSFAGSRRRRNGGWRNSARRFGNDRFGRQRFGRIPRYGGFLSLGLGLFQIVEQLLQALGAGQGKLDLRALLKISQQHFGRDGIPRTAADDDEGLPAAGQGDEFVFHQRGCLQLRRELAAIGEQCLGQIRLFNERDAEHVGQSGQELWLVNRLPVQGGRADLAPFGNCVICLVEGLAGDFGSVHKPRRNASELSGFAPARSARRREREVSCPPASARWPRALPSHAGCSRTGRADARWL